MAYMLMVFNILKALRNLLDTISSCKTCLCYISLGQATIQHVNETCIQLTCIVLLGNLTRNDAGQEIASTDGESGSGEGGRAGKGRKEEGRGRA